MAPRLSICIPTYNRALLLDDCLERLAVAPDDGSVEIVVSDNGSTDETQAVIAAHSRRNPSIRGHRLPENRGQWANRLNALYQARGDVMTFLADDDSLIIENLLSHVERMEREPDIVGTYVDWIAWDDREGRELHRYFHLDGPVDFRPEDPLGLVNFVLQRIIPPEVLICRREALVRAQSDSSRALPFHVWMYALSRLGRIRFDPLPFYREHRVLQDRFARTHWANMELALHYIGDEMRLTLESLLLLAFQDLGHPRVPDDQVANARRMIDRVLGSRIGLEIERACARGDWILAIELRRRQVLWDGPGTRDDIQRDMLRLVLPAALQAISQTVRSLSDVDGLALRGFASRQIHDTFAKRYPETLLLAEGDDRPALIVHRDEGTLAADTQAEGARNILVLERLLDLYRVARERVDLSGL
jgi:glycosyltransferase involved in cell wall biosynthesis